MAPFSPTSCPCPGHPPTAHSLGCTGPQPGMGTGMRTLPLYWAVMRFLLGCLDRKSQPKNAKSLSELHQPPAHHGAHGGAPSPAATALLGWHQHLSWPGAPPALAGIGHLFTQVPLS